MKHLHHLETGVMSVTLCCLLWKIMSARILKFFVTRNCENILVSLQKVQSVQRESMMRPDIFFQTSVGVSEAYISRCSFSVTQENRFQ